MSSICTVHARGAMAVVVVTGPGFGYEDASGFPECVLEKVVEMGATAVVVSFVDVVTFSSMGLGVLIDLRRQLLLRHCPIVLAGLAENVRMLFRVARLAHLFAFAPSVEAATEALGARGDISKPIGA